MTIFRAQTEQLSEIVGIAPDAVRIILGLIFGQIFSLLYRTGISYLPKSFPKQILLLSIGLFLAYFVYGKSCLHHALSGLGFYFLFKFLDWELALKINFVFQLGYLVVGYYFNNMVPDYAINWTTSSAIISLKLIGFGFDLNDSKNKGAQLPSILNVLGYTFFFGTYVVGPLDNYTRFAAFLDGDLFRKDTQPPLATGLKRVGSGIFYLAMSLLFTSIFTTQFLLSPEYLEMGFILRLLYVTAWGHCSLYKYLGVWCIAESSCMYMGYTYAGEGRWDGLRNVATLSFHKALSLQNILESWNINTSNWCGKYIYKRCRFLGNKSLSKVITMVFLAFWHGLHLGYFSCFLQEFVYLHMEKCAENNTILHKAGQLLPKPLLMCLLWLYPKVFLSFALVGFELYHYHTIMYVYKSLYFVCPIIAAVLVMTNVFFSPPPLPQETEEKFE